MAKQNRQFCRGRKIAVNRRRKKNSKWRPRPKLAIHENSSFVSAMAAGKEKEIGSNKKETNL